MLQLPSVGATSKIFTLLRRRLYFLSVSSTLRIYLFAKISCSYCFARAPAGHKALALQNPMIALRTFLLPTRPTSPRFKIEKCLLVAGSSEKVLQVSINFIPVGFMPGRDCFTDIFEGFKMSLGVPITEFMISNHRNPRFKKLS